MKKKNSGFTLVELLAVIVVLSIIITLVSSGIIAVMNKSRKNMAVEVRSNLEEVALTYAIENYHLEKCSLSFSNELYVNQNISNLNNPDNASCFKRVTVKDVKNAGLFEDNRGFCSEDDVVIVYRFSYENENKEILSEYKTYISENACNN